MRQQEPWVTTKRNVGILWVDQDVPKKKKKTGNVTGCYEQSNMHLCTSQPSLPVKVNVVPLPALTWSTGLLIRSCDPEPDILAQASAQR